MHLRRPLLYLYPINRCSTAPQMGPHGATWPRMSNQGKDRAKALWRSLEMVGKSNQTIARVWTLPACAYTDPGVHAAEKEKMFGCTWQVVGHFDQVANPGDYFTIEIIGEPLLIVRAADGALSECLGLNRWPKNLRLQEHVTSSC